MADYINMCKLYGVTHTESVSTNNATFCRRAKVTLTEVLLLEGIVLSLQDHDSGVAHMNKIIGSMSAGPQSENHMDVGDLNPALWHFVQRRLSGLPL